MCICSNCFSQDPTVPPKPHTLTHPPGYRPDWIYRYMHCYSMLLCTVRFSHLKNIHQSVQSGLAKKPSRVWFHPPQWRGALSLCRVPTAHLLTDGLLPHCQSINHSIWPQAISMSPFSHLCGNLAKPIFISSVRTTLHDHALQCTAVSQQTL